MCATDPMDSSKNFFSAHAKIRRSAEHTYYSSCSLPDSKACPGTGGHKQDAVAIIPHLDLSSMFRPLPGSQKKDVKKFWMINKVNGSKWPEVGLTCLQWFGEKSKNKKNPPPHTNTQEQQNHTNTCCKILFTQDQEKSVLLMSY